MKINIAIQGRGNLLLDRIWKMRCILNWFLCEYVDSANQSQAWNSSPTCCFLCFFVFVITNFVTYTHLKHLSFHRWLFVRLCFCLLLGSITLTVFYSVFYYFIFDQKVIERHNLCNGFYKKAFFSSWEKVHKINLFRSFNFFKDGDALLLYDLEYSEKYAQTGCILNVRSFYDLVAAPDLNEDSDDEYYILLARDSSLIRKEQAMNRRVWTYLYFLFFYFLFWFLIGIVNIVTDARKSLSVVTLIH